MLENTQENKMGVMPENKLLLSMSVPMMISMLVQAFYNIVDSLFVSRISEEALTAVSYAFPVQSLIIALAGGVCVGVNALLSRALGEKDKKKVQEYAKNGIFLLFVIYLIFLFVGIFLVKPFYVMQTDNELIIKYGIQYLSIICGVSFGCCFQFIFDRLLQSTGKTVYTMITQMTGAIINIILDPILIFGLFGMPKMGVAGAAAATVIGQVIAAIMSIIFNIRKNKEIELSLKGFRPEKKVIGRIMKVAVPSIIMQSIGSVMVVGMNAILGAFTETAVAVFGIYFKMQSFIFMPIFGLNNGMVPIVAYNYGARKKDRLVKIVRLSIMYAVVIMMFGFAVFQLMPDVMLNLFEASEHMKIIGVPALKIISLHFIFAGFNIIGGSMFQALGNAVYSMITSICRQLCVLLPAAFLLSLAGNVNLVWWAFPIAEVFATAITCVFLIKINNKVLRKI